MRYYTFILLFVSVTFLGCGLSQVLSIDQNLYYKNLNVVAKKRWKHSKEPLKIYDYTSQNEKYLIENGYVLIAYDAIRHTYIGYQNAVEVGNYIGASVMLYKHEYVGTSSGYTVARIYNPGETYLINSQTTGIINTNRNSTTNIYGNDLSIYGSTSSNSRTTYNSQTTTAITGPGSFSYYSIPYSNDYYDQWAIFYLKKYYKSTTQDISVNKSANEKSSIIGYLPKNTWFEILSTNKEFRKIKCKDKIGYIPSYIYLE